jgi:hypothetical protein
LLRVIAEMPRTAQAPATMSVDRASDMPDSRTPAVRWLRFGDRRWPTSQLAAAALLLITLGFGYISLRAPSPSDREGRFPAIWTTSDEGAPAGVSNSIRLLRWTLTRPFGRSQSGIGIWGCTFAPGAYDREVGHTNNLGDQLFFVESGTIGARLVSGDRPPENLGTDPDSVHPAATVAADGMLWIAAGEVGLLPGGTTVELSNDGTAPANVLWLLVDWSMHTDSQGVTWNAPGPTLPNASGPPLTLTIDRATLAPNAKINAAPAPAITSIGLLSPPYGYLLMDRDGSARNISASPRDVYIMTMTPLKPAASSAP